MPNSSGRPSRPMAGRTRRPFNSSSSSSSRTGSGERSHSARPSTGARTGGYSRSGSSSPSRGGSSSFSRGGFSGGRSSGGGRSFGGNRGGGGRGRGRVMSTFDVSKFINLNPAKPVTEAPYQAKHTFNDFGLDAHLAAAIAEMGLVTPSPIQNQVIPLILEGNDVVGLAQTGTGKTAAFLVPVIHKTLKERGRQTLILTPTRELAIQIEQEFRRLTPRMNLFSKSVEGLVHEFLRKPITVSVRKTDITSSVTQDVVRYEHHNKFDTLVNLLKTEEFTRVIVFGAMKHSVEKLSLELVHAGIKADAIHGNKSHVQRQRALKNFKDGRVQVLVATDVAARGIHVDDVSHVINYDLPGTYEDYVHRIGRTGRSDKSGKALTFVPA